MKIKVDDQHAVWLAIARMQKKNDSWEAFAAAAIACLKKRGWQNIPKGFRVACNNCGFSFNSIGHNDYCKLGRGKP